MVVGVVALGMDGGRMMEERRRGQATADAAALAAAADLYANRLLKHEGALAYMAKRGFARPLLERYRVGYAAGGELIARTQRTHVLELLLTVQHASHVEAAPTALLAAAPRRPERDRPGERWRCDRVIRRIRSTVVQTGPRELPDLAAFYGPLDRSCFTHAVGSGVLTGAHLLKNLMIRSTAPIRAR